MNLRILGEGVPMNQTDLQGETERALRALTCEGCKSGETLIDGKFVESEWHYGTGKTIHEHSSFPCTSKHPELLPLFNAGISGAYAAAAKLCDAYGREGDRLAQEYACETADEIAARIRALTPADARHGRCQGCGGPHPFDTSVPSEKWNAVIRAKNLPEFLCLTCIVREFVKAGQDFTAELWGDVFDGAPISIAIGNQTAAIASAEARARLEEHLLTCADCFDDANRGTYRCARHLEIVDKAAVQDALPCDPNDQVSEAQFQRFIWDAIASVLGPKGQILADSLQEKLTIGIRDYLRWNCERVKAHKGEK